jgi:hypothetical protein
MTASDYVAFFAMAVVLCGVIYLVIFLGDLPANIAKDRNHPQVAAVRAMSWLGLLFTGGVVYILALVWAFFEYPPGEREASEPDARTEIEELRSRVTALETTLASQGDKS